MYRWRTRRSYYTGKLQKLNMKPSPWTLTIKNHIGWWEWNDPHSSLNLLSLRALKELEAFIDKLERADLKALVLMSGKTSVFSAGADIKELKNIKKS